MPTQTPEIMSSLRLTGWKRLPAMTDAEFRRLVDSLGKAWCETTVALRSEVQTYLCRPQPVPFHTDHPDATFVAWRCEHPDDDDGSQLLVDGFAALSACGQAARRSLLKAHVEVHIRKGDAAVLVPVVRESAEGDRLCFAPWLRPIENDPGILSAFAWMETEVARMSEEAVQAVRLNDGEVLVVDNGRMLHGRSGLNPASRRRLRRFWITHPSSVPLAHCRDRLESCRPLDPRWQVQISPPFSP